MSTKQTPQGFIIDEKPPLLTPQGFEKNEDGIFLREDVRDKNSHEVIRTHLIPLSRTPFDIMEQMENPDTREVFFKIAFEGKEIIMPASDLSNKRGIIALAGFGVNTIEANAKQLCKYIMEYRALNHIEKSLIYDRFGWKDDGSFVLGNKKYFLNGVTQVSLSPLSQSRETNAIVEKGTLAGWVQTISGMMKYDTQRFKMYIACVPPLLKLLKASNFSLADIGDTSVGKTRTTNVAMSMYGKPYGQDSTLELSADTTKTAIETVMKVFTDLPIHPDEIQNVKKDVLDHIVYMIGNGKGRMRGTKTGGLQELANIRTVALFTSERSVITESSFGGESMRLIEVFKGLGKTDIKAVKQFEDGISDNYGTFAPLLINYIIKNQDEILALHAESKKSSDAIQGKYAFEPRMVGIAGRLSNTFASILTAGKVFEKLYKIIGGEMRDPEGVVIPAFHRCVTDKESESYVQRGLAHIISWMNANRAYFLANGLRETDSAGYSRQYRVLGDITSESYNFLPTELRNELEKNGKFDFKRLVDDLFEGGFLDYDKDKKLRTVRIEGTPVKVYSLIRAKIDITVADDVKETKV